MAHLLADHSTGGLQCLCKRATFVLCTANILVGLFMLQAALIPIHHDSSSSSVAPRADDVSPKGIEVMQTRPTAEELERIETSNRLRRELLPVQLIERVKEIQKETVSDINRSRLKNLARQKVALELAQRLRDLKRNNHQYILLGALQGWNTTNLEKTNSVTEATGGGEEKAVDPKVAILNE
ncbi:uncharacterized protein [Physcomitrium patens]|uniref:Transmembrane protein n=2 Tax=Physcomitrium patens TaxID=3218 RepID=A0A7I4DDP2_PHYPA|nr:uncharacterized protein LOC112279516 isoform X3 [Physcomitrium patens]|eukprot:XP_024369804.1 uncharacterized protein LOC112279516 isoform X3 [Physcomitrella patens]